MNKELEIFGVLETPPELHLNIDKAVDAIFKEKGWPLLGGPSGRGWSYFSQANRCGQLFKKTYDVDVGEVIEKRHGQPLQIGALYHTLQALYQAAMMNPHAYVLPNRGGLVCAGRGVRVPLQLTKLRWKVAPTNVSDLLEGLRALCASDLPSPELFVVEEAERLWDAHTNWWDHKEDVEPLGIEVFAAHPQLGYTCRYDMIGRVGPDDPMLPEGVCIFEKKSAKWIDEKYLEGWALDGEILGQIMCWKAGGMEEMFGPLQALVMDIVSKGKVPECRRLVLPPTLPAVQNHARWVAYQGAEIQMWRASGAYPQRFGNCWTRWGRCEEFENCVLGLT